MMLAALLALIVLPYWPGEDCRYCSSPEYPERIEVMSTIGFLPNLAEARRDWNRCGARVRFVRGDEEPFTPGTVTIILSDDGGAYGGPASGGYGVVLLGDAWTRTRGVISHELGHTVGFGHTRRNSVMGPANRVTPLDCRGLRHYYGRR